MLKPSFPQKAGIVTDVIDKNKVYVALTGVINDVLRNLIPHKIYIIDMDGNLSSSYHNIEQGKSFLIAGKDHNSASIIYNGL